MLNLHFEYDADGSYYPINADAKNVWKLLDKTGPSTLTFEQIRILNDMNYAVFVRYKNSSLYSAKDIK